jgi:hypothetical protein
MSKIYPALRMFHPFPVLSYNAARFCSGSFFRLPFNELFDVQSITQMLVPLMANPMLCAKLKAVQRGLPYARQALVLKRGELSEILQDKIHRERGHSSEHHPVAQRLV